MTINTVPVRFAQVEPTTVCNFSCGFCCGRRMDQAYLPLATFNTFLDTIPTLAYLELQGEGEPLMHPDFFEMLAIATARGIHTSVITNGSLFSASVVEQLLDSGLTSLRISTETHDAERFKRIRGGSLERVRTGLTRLMARRAERGLSRPSVGLSVTVLASTLDDLPGIFQMYTDLGLDGGIALQPLNRMPGYTEHYPEELAHEFLQQPLHEARYLHHIASEAHQRIQSQPASPYRHFYDLLFEPSHKERAQGHLDACPWLTQGLYMDRHGHFAPCCMVKNATATLGTLGQTAISKVLELRTTIAQTLAQGRVPRPCQGCNVAQSIVQRGRANAGQYV